MLPLRLAGRKKNYGQSVRPPAHGGTRSFLYSLSLEPYHFRDPLGLLSFVSISFLSLSVAGGGGRRAAAIPPGGAATTFLARARGRGRGGPARWCGAERRGWADAARGGLPGGSSARGAAARSLGLAGGGRDLPRRSPPVAAQRRGGGAAGWRGGGRAAGRRGGEVRRRSGRVLFFFFFSFFIFLFKIFFI